MEKRKSVSIYNILGYLRANDRIPKFKAEPPKDKRYTTQFMSIITETVYEVFAGNITNLSFDSVNYCLFEGLRSGLAMEISNTISSISKKYCQAQQHLIESAPPHKFLHLLVMCFKALREKVFLLENLFLYFDRNKDMFNGGVSIRSICFSNWSSIIFATERDRADLFNMLNALFHYERNGKDIDSVIVKETIKILYDIESLSPKPGIYSEFTENFLRAMDRYVYLKSGKGVLRLDFQNYLSDAIGIYNQEVRRVRMYFPGGTIMEDAKRILSERLLFDHMKEILEKEETIRELAMSNDYKQLKNIYTFFRKKRAFWRKFVDMFLKGMESEFPPIEGDSSVVPEIIKIIEKKKKIISVCFNGEPKLLAKLNGRINHYLRQHDEIAELLAIHLDKYIRHKSGSSDKDAFELEAELDRIFHILNPLAQKDLFKSFYEHYLAKRLLFGDTGRFNNELEYIILSKLKEKYGNGFTYSMERMMNDMKASVASSEKFKKYLDTGGFLENVAYRNLSLDVRVLTSGVWNTSASIHVVVPPAIKEQLDLFESYYTFLNIGKKVEWNFRAGYAELQARGFRRKRFTVKVTTLQMFVILLVSGTDKKQMSFRELEKTLELNRNTLVSILESLSGSSDKNKRLLKKIPRTSSIGAHTVFVVDVDNFNRKKRRYIDLTVENIKRTEKEELEAQRGRVSEDRKLVIDSYIVRIMKTRKELSYDELITDLFKMLEKRFRPTIKTVKMRIEDLIARKYIKRSDEDRQRFIYLA